MTRLIISDIRAEIDALDEIIEIRGDAQTPPTRGRALKHKKL
ncbi:MAG: hypothetical protein U9Q68_06760 [Euryarchaeota archaeon]|nr:hypothetical protein [Euryarchaeota archaeon]